MAHPHRQYFETEEPEENPTPEARARKQIKRRRELQGALVGFVVVSAFLVAIWALSGGGYFWPGWVMAAWAVVMVLRFWRHRPVTGADVDAELRRMGPQGR